MHVGWVCACVPVCVMWCTPGGVVLEGCCVRDDGSGQWGGARHRYTNIYGLDYHSTGSPTTLMSPCTSAMGLIVGMCTDNGSRQLAV